jgi:hypothetical protein
VAAVAVAAVQEPVPAQARVLVARVVQAVEPVAQVVQAVRVVQVHAQAEADNQCPT